MNIGKWIVLAFAISLTHHLIKEARAQTLPTQLPPIKSPSVQSPSVATPTVKAPTAPAASTSSPSATKVPVPGGSTIGGPAAALVTRAFDENAYKVATASNTAVVIVFSSSTDLIWQKQAPVLQVVLREAEFAKLPSFQVDASNMTLFERFSATPSTILIMKDGIERMRSTRMVNPDVIRKMLRLHSAL